LIGGPTYGEATNANNFEFSLIEGSDFIGLIEAFQNDVGQ
jgi:hypothetical protein